MPAESKAIRSTLVIRSFRHEDTDAIAQILQQSRHAANWSTQGLAALGTNAGERALVSEARGGVTGFLVGRQAAGEAEVLNLAVTPDQRRKGVATALLEAFLEAIASNGTRRVFLEVRESNAVAIAFYEALGFATIGRRTAYYQDPSEDALVLERALTG